MTYCPCGSGKFFEACHGLLLDDDDSVGDGDSATAQGTTGAAPAWSSLRVFISSTFSDMHAERDYLVKRVFPELREWCERRRLQLVEVDLRWGVTEADVIARNRLIEACFERIDRCRPFFLCLLGQRYGQLLNPSAISDSTLTAYPELVNLLASPLSITELEVIHAATAPLRRTNPDGTSSRPPPARHAFFYLRDDTHVSAMPKEPALLRRLYHDDFESDPALRAELKLRLLNLRERITAGHHTTREYRARWDPDRLTPAVALPLPSYSVDPRRAEDAAAFNRALIQGRLVDFVCTRGATTSSSDLASVILDDFKRAITDSHPYHREVDYADDPLRKELYQQERFLMTVVEDFVEREGDFDELDAFLMRGSAHLCVLTGPAGLGKTTLLAKWLERLPRQPTARTIIARFVGQSERSSSLPTLLRSILEELRDVARKLDDETDLPTDPAMLLELWPSLLALAAQSGPIVLVIDGVNQLEGDVEDLDWALTLPERVKIAMSLRDDDDDGRRVLRSLHGETDVIVHAMQPFDKLEHRRELIFRHLARSFKELDEHHVDTLARLKGASSPLFLKTIVTELRVFGSFAELGRQIMSTFGWDPVTAFHAVLRRLESEVLDGAIAVKADSLVRNIFGLLAHARSGLSTRELAEMVGAELGIATSLRLELEGTIELLLYQVRPFLMRRGTRHDILYEAFLIAARDRYVAGGKNAILGARPAPAWHSSLADYFAALPLYVDDESSALASAQANARRAAVLPHHLLHAERWDELTDTMCDLEFVEAKVRSGLVHELRAEYRLVREALPESESERSEGAARRQRLERHAEMLANYASGATPWCPELLATMPLTNNEIDRDLQCFAEASPRLHRLAAFERFIEGSAGLLERHGQRPRATVELALGSAGGGPVDAAAEAIAARETSAPLFIRARANRSPLRLRPALLRQLRPTDTPGLPQRADHAHSIALSLDGRTFVTGQRDGDLGVWDFERGRRRFTLAGHTMLATAVALSADGRIAVTGGYDKTVRVWDLRRGQRLRVMEGHEDVITGVALTPDARRALSVSQDGAVMVWNVEAGVCTGRIDTQTRGVHAVALAARGSIALTGGGGDLCVWDIDAGSLLFALDAFRGTPTSMAITPDARRAVSSALDGTIQVWEPLEGRSHVVLARGESLERAGAVALTPDGRVAISQTGDGALRVWDAETGTCLRVLAEHMKEMTGVAIAADGRFALSVHQGREVYVWDVAAGRSESSAPTHGKGTSSLAIIDRTRAISAGGSVACEWDMRDGTCTSVHADGWLAAALRVRSGRQIPVPDVAGDACALALSGDTRVAAVGTKQGLVLAWDTESGLIRTLLEYHSLPQSSAGEGPDEGSSRDGVNSTTVAALSFCENGRLLASAYRDDTVGVWDVETGKPVCVLRGHTNRIVKLAAVANDMLLLSASWDHSIRLWDPRSGRCLAALEHDDQVNDFVVTHHGDCVVSASGSFYEDATDFTVRVWELRSGRCLRSLSGHTGRVTALALVENDEWGLSAGWDHTLRVWNLRTGECALVVPVEASITALAVTLEAPGRLRVAFGDTKGQVVIGSISNLDTAGASAHPWTTGREFLDLPVENAR